MFVLIILVLAVIGCITYHIGISNRGVFVETSEWKKVIRRTSQLIMCALLLIIFYFLSHYLSINLFGIGTIIFMLCGLIILASIPVVIKQLANAPMTSKEAPQTIVKELNRSHKRNAWEYFQNTIITALILVIITAALLAPLLAVFLNPWERQDSLVLILSDRLIYLPSNFEPLYTALFFATYALCCLLLYQLSSLLQKDNIPNVEVLQIQKVSDELDRDSFPV